MGGKGHVASSSQPFRAPSRSHLCGTMGQVTLVVRPEQLLCTPRTLSSRISRGDLLVWLGGASHLRLFCRARELILRGKGAGHIPGMDSSLDPDPVSGSVGTECKRRM